MKHLAILLFLLSSLSACSSNQTNFSTATQYQPNTGAYALGLNMFKKSYYTVPRVAQAEYDRCVSFALREMSVGQECTWEVPGNSIGIVKLVQIDATGCHYLFNTMRYRGKQKNFQETACYSHSNKKWMFQ